MQDDPNRLWYIIKRERKGYEEYGPEAAYWNGERYGPFDYALAYSDEAKRATPLPEKGKWIIAD